MSDSICRHLLGFLILSPHLLENTDLSANDFTPGRLRRVFEIIATTWENSRPESIDQILLAERLGGDAHVSFISSLLDGLPKAQPESFASYVRELKRRNISARILKKISGQPKDGNLDLAEVRQDLAEYDGLEKIEVDIPKAEPIEELCLRPIPPIEFLVKPIIGRHLLTLIGGQKGVGKSLYAIQLSLHSAAGMNPFISDEIQIVSPCNVLYIQQEISLPGMKDRAFKMRLEKVFNLGGRFKHFTTTGRWWSLDNQDDVRKIKRLILENKTDILILDPLYTFSPNGLNSDKDAGPVIAALSAFKDEFNIALCAIHHFSNKENPEEARFTAGRFMGQSNIANAADVLIALDFLHPRYKNQVLPLPFNHYVNVEISTRHGEWPEHFTMERKPDALLFKRSTIWQDIGKHILPEQIYDLVAANDGEMLQSACIHQLRAHAAETTIKRAIREAVKQGSIEKQRLPGRGAPVILRIRNV
jgi:hypothetical protein